VILAITVIVTLLVVVTVVVVVTVASLALVVLYLNRVGPFVAVTLAVMTIRVAFA
jgi:hypothetical protein